MASPKYRECFNQLAGLQRGFYRELLTEARSWSNLYFLLTRQYSPSQFEQSLKRPIEQLGLDVYKDSLIKKLLQEHPEEKMNIESILKNMTHSFSMGAVHFLHYVALSTMKRVLEHCYLDIRLGPKDDLIVSLGELAKRKRIIFLPTHRTYIDGLLHSVFLYCLNVTQLPVQLAGDNLKNLSVVSSLMNNFGLFFGRRNFGSDPTYRLVFRAYVQSILLGGETPISFALEGTRSRSGKNNWPFFGMLKTLLEPVFRGQIDDLLLVPVTLNYERILEEDVFVKEITPLFDAYDDSQMYKKPKENIWNLLSSLWTIQWNNYGELYWKLGKPISVAEAIDSHPNIRKVLLLHTKTPLDQEIQLHEIEKDFIFQLGVQIQQAQNESVIVSTFSLAAVIMLAESTREPATFDLELLIEDVSSMALLIPDHVNTTINGLSVERDLERSIRVHSNLAMSLGNSQLKVSMHQPQMVSYLRIYANLAIPLLIDHAIGLYTSGDVTLFKQVRYLLQQEFICHSSQLNQLYASHRPHLTTQLTERAKQALLAQVKYYLNSYYRIFEWFHAQPDALYHQVVSLELVKNLLEIPKDVVSNVFQMGLKNGAFVAMDIHEGTFRVSTKGAKVLLEKLSKLLHHGH